MATERRIKLNMISPLPKCTGTELASEWLNSFEAGMLDRGMEEEDVKMAKYWKTCIVGGSPAEAWYETLAEGERKSFKSMETSYRGMFATARVKTDAEALQELRKLRISDEELNRKEANGTLKHESYARDLLTASSRIPTTALSDDLKASMMLEGVGPELRKFIRMSVGRTPGVKSVVDCIRGLTDIDIESIVEPYRWKRQLEELKRLDSSRPRTFGSQVNPDQDSFRSNSNYQRPANGGGQEQMEPIAIGPFSQDASGQRAYADAIKNWYSRHGSGAVASLSRPFPLTLGTAKPGSGECFRCGWLGHLRPHCTATQEIPENEQRYRGQVMNEGKKRFTQAQARPSGNYGSGANATVPIRGLMTADSIGQDGGYGFGNGGMDGPAWEPPYFEAGNDAGFDH